MFAYTQNPCMHALPKQLRSESDGATAKLTMRGTCRSSGPSPRHTWPQTPSQGKKSIKNKYLQRHETGEQKQQRTKHRKLIPALPCRALPDLHPGRLTLMHAERACPNAGQTRTFCEHLYEADRRIAKPTGAPPDHAMPVLLI
ncbi:uncharacterized protein PV09_03027 [Verruconis gallopava]|uniref:Uncharacterized protein n=1 Tax=Verruconis gallopava TaxID=253628 RepID=A0A0D1XSW6_9PEZI|nr:uncharacterized protein PV09_03027 [Verruconis gallopava]KIW05821.1 hypothetical protein PV09_03027 [Verruconis gallopava]